MIMTIIYSIKETQQMARKLIIVNLKHHTHIDDFALNVYPTCSLYDLNDAQLDIRVSMLEFDDRVGGNASRVFS